MGSACEVKLYHDRHQNIDAIVSVLLDELARLEEKYTRFKPTSVTSKINAAAGRPEPIRVDEETLLLLNYAEVMFQQSEGLFDITSGVLRRAWNFNSNTLPHPDAIGAATELIGWQKLERENDCVRLPNGGMEIDFGGFVKEYAADVLASKCLALGINHGLINLGGDIHLLGPHPDGSPWTVGIQHPRILKQPIVSLELSHGAIATSGDYERFMLIDGLRYCHLLNPKTGQSIQPAFASVSVVAEQCIVAGSFSTIAMLKSETQPEWIQQQDVPFITVDQAMLVGGSLLPQ